MQVKLRVLGRTTPVAIHPAAVRADGTRRYFFLGKGDDCYLSCDAEGVRPRHCVIVVDGGAAVIHRVDPAGQVYVNQTQVHESRLLRGGDRLQIGLVRFEVLIDADAAAPVAAPADAATGGAIAEAVETRSLEDAADNYISQWLDSVDAIEHERLMANPELRRFRAEPAPAAKIGAKTDATAEHKDDGEHSAKDKDRHGKEKKQPGKLPPRPKITHVRSDEAAASVLTRTYGATIQNLVRKRPE